MGVSNPFRGYPMPNSLFYLWLMKRFSLYVIAKPAFFSNYHRYYFLMVFIFLSQNACRQRRESNFIEPGTPRVVRAKGNTVPIASTLPPRVTPVDKPKTIRAGKPKVTQIVSHEYPAGIASICFSRSSTNIHSRRRQI